MSRLAVIISGLEVLVLVTLLADIGTDGVRYHVILKYKCSLYTSLPLSVGALISCTHHEFIVHMACVLCTCAPMLYTTELCFKVIGWVRVY